MTSVATLFSRSLLGMAALTAALASAPVQAADQVLASASASVTNLKIQVIDLTPDDGIAASVTFSPGVLIEERYDAGAQDFVINQTTFDLNALPSAAWTGTVSTGTYSFSSSGLSLASQVKASDLHTAVWSPDLGNYVSGSTRILHLETGDQAPFILGANTAVIISGNAVIASTSASASGSEFVSLFDPAVSDVSQVTVGAQSNAYLQLSLDAQDWAAAEGYDNHRSLSVASVEGVDDIGAVTNSPFLFGLKNASSEAKTNAFTLSMWVLATGAAMAPEAPAIPEPSSCALMGLGLVGIGLARRRVARKA